MKNNKRLSLILSMTLALGAATTVGASSIKDIKVDRVYGKDAKVNILSKNNIIKGYEDGSLKLDQEIKRSEITKLLVFANGGEDLAKSLEKIKGTYKDVEILHWANGVINAASQNPVETNGLYMVKGYEDGTFRPENNITYAELAKMLVVLADENLKEEDIKNSDNNWPTEWITRAQNLGIFEDITFADVNKTVNREDAFTMFYNALEKNKIEIEDKKEESKSVSLLADNNRKSKKRRKSSRSSSNNSNIDKDEDKKPSDDNDKEPEKPVDPTEPEELKKEFHKAAKEAGNKLAEEEELIYSIDYNNGIAKVRVNLDKLEDVKNLENLNTGLFSEVLPNLGVKSVKIGDKDYSVDPSAENFEINKMIEAVLGQLSNNNIKYSAKIEKGGVEFEENFDVTFEFLGNEESKAAKLEELYSVIEEARQVSIKLLNKQKRFYLTDYKTNLLPEEYKNQTTFDFLTDGKGGEPTKETLMSNYVSGSGLATVLGFKNKSETDKAQKARIEFIKSCLDMNTLTVNNENITLPNNILGLMGVKVGDLLGEKKISVKVKDEIAKDTFIEHIIHFDIHVDATEEPKEGEKEQ